MTTYRRGANPNSHLRSRKVTDGQIVEAYGRLGNIWKVGLELGVVGQTVHKHLKRLGYANKNAWTEEQTTLLRATYQAADGGQPLNLDDLVYRLGHPKSSISRKAQQLGLTNAKRHRSPEFCVQVGLRIKRWIAEKGHPRGAYKTGKVIRICPTCGRFFDVFPASPQVYCSLRCGRMKRQSEGHQGYSKTGKRADLDNQYFRSRWEANYARYLNMLIANGADIVGWEYESDTFEFARIKRGTRFYTPDFKVHFADGHCEYHEVKGWRHPKGETAIKRFAKYFPQHTLIIIDASWFQAVKRQGLPALLPGWEEESRHRLDRTNVELWEETL